MAAYDVLFMEPGAEYYYTAGISVAGLWNGGANGQVTNVAPAGRATRYAIGANNGFSRNFGVNYQSWIIGWAMYQPAWANNTGYMGLRDAATTQVDIRSNTSGNFYFTRNGTQIGSTSTFVGTINSWHYYEIAVTIASGTSGSATLYVDGVAQLTVTGVNTQATANAFANAFELFCQTGSSYYKDIYVMADTGSGSYTGPLGDITVAVGFPNTAGPDQDWSLGAGASQLAAVQDGINHTGTWPDGDTSYIYSQTAGQISDFQPQALSLTGQIFAVAHVTYARKDDAGARSIRQITKSGATVHDNGSDIALGNSYQYYFDIMSKDPNTAAQWTQAGYNAAYFGVKEIT